MLASAQTGSARPATIIRMITRLDGWWKLWIVLAVVWTVVAISSGWMNLPRARHMPHDPQFLSKLSAEAASIMLRTETRTKPVRSTFVWTEQPRMVRMSNGTRLTFPATTTDERAAFVATEYRQLLNIEADKQRGPYLAEMLAIWLGPLLVAGVAVSLLCRGYRTALATIIRGSRARPSAARALASAFAAGGQRNRTDRDSATAQSQRSLTGLSVN